MEGKIEAQKLKIARFNVFCEAVLNMPEPNLTKSYLETKAKLIQESWSKVEDAHDVIIEGTETEGRTEIGYFKRQEFDKAFITYDKVMLKIQSKLEKFIKPTTASMQFPDNIVINTNKHKSSVKLKPIDVPNFSGEFKEWTSFKNMFESLVHNNNDLTKVQKFHYLKGCLTGEAARMISRYNIDENEYENAYKVITDRYDNDVVLIDTHIIAIISQPDLKTESTNGIKELLDVTSENIHALTSLHVDTSTWDPILLILLVPKLDSATKHLWDLTLKPKVKPTLKEFLKFLESRFHALGCQQKFKFSIDVALSSNQHQNNKKPFTKEPHYNSSSNFKYNYSDRNYTPTVHQNFHNSTIYAQRKCPCQCDDVHNIFECDRFKKADPWSRTDYVVCAKLCKNCLKGHNGRCKLQPGCQKCGKYHHTWLHFGKEESSNINQSTATPIGIDQQSKQEVSSNQQEKSLISHHAHIENGGDQVTVVDRPIAWDEPILLATAIVIIKSPRDNNFYPFRALLDQASEASYISEYALQFLGLKRTKIAASTSGLGGITTGMMNSVVDFEVSSKRNPSFNIKVQAPVVSKVTNTLPSMRLNRENWIHIQDLELADPEFHVPGKIDLLLGAPVYGYLLLPGLIKASRDTPVAQNTEFGWILSGGTRSPTTPKHTIANFHLRVDDQLRKFFEQEEISQERIWTQEEKECETFFEQTFKRNDEGRFIVALPFKKEPKLLGSSKGQAISRLMKLEGRLASNANLKTEYSGILHEYEELNHTTLVGNLVDQNENASELESSVYYLPHHAVFKPESTTTKTRVVFDASAKTTTGVSLNDLLMVGPTLQEDLVSILLRWRSHRIIFTADIAKMYRQVLIREGDRKFLKFLYRENRSDPIKVYQHNMVTFGVASATYLAVRALKQLAIEEKENYPIASEVILRDFYMDDGMSGVDSVEDGIKLCSDLKKLLANGKFELRKFISNSSKLLESIPEKDRELTLPLEIDITENVKTLGIRYNPATDKFQFKVNLEVSDDWPTKRSMLSETSKLFDPLGWLAPVIIKAKILFQELWLAGLTWDQKLPENIAKEWLTFRNDLHQLEEIRIDRWIGSEKEYENFELHGFGDASQKAYSAVIYSRIVNKDGSIKVTMLTSKTRVAPLKPITLPRLELCGAVLVANLMENTRKALNIDRSKLHAWSDSTITLGWLRTNPSKFKTFVANRVVEVHNYLNTDHWHHIEGENNPADCASRGISAAELINHKLWWNGPQCLHENRTSWNQDLEIPEATLELKSTLIKSHIVRAQEECVEKYIGSYSNINRLFRQTAFQLRFINNIRSPTNKITNSTLTVKELQSARDHLVRLCQEKQFEREIDNLKRKENISHKSNIVSLNPFLDEESLMRVGGRLEESDLDYERKHPIILSNGHLTNLIISDAHQKCLHGGNKLTMNVVKDSYWIINLKWKVKKHISQCVNCFRFKAITSEQIMCNLPRARIVESSPFTHTGVDYAGPFNIKASNIKSPPTRIKPTMIEGVLVKSIPKVPVYKGYIALFVCFSTKAIHLEVVSDMTTDAFLAALNRFTSRRSSPTDMYSDNGTTFVGAKNVLSDDYERSLVDYERVAIQLTKDKIQWHFIPPTASHFGGIWESNIKSMKHHLRRVIGDTVLTFEELTTIMCQIEACLNSRPLCPLTEDLDDLNVLTPGHFLVGRPMIAPPSGKSRIFTGDLRERWRLQQKLTQNIWDAWSKDYLSQLQQRIKWREQRKNMKAGDMVLLKDDDIPPMRWPLARVLDVYTGRDDNVRVASIRTKLPDNQRFGVYERPISKLCLLPISDNDCLIDSKANPRWVVRPK